MRLLSRLRPRVKLVPVPRARVVVNGEEVDGYELSPFHYGAHKPEDGEEAVIKQAELDRTRPGRILRQYLSNHVPSDGINLIASERRRQVHVEGWTGEHDDRHTRGELVDAATCYLARARREEANWPFEVAAWRPEGIEEPTVRDLTKAGALIAAEIDRLLRLEGGHE